MAGFAVCSLVLSLSSLLSLDGYARNWSSLPVLVWKPRSPSFMPWDKDNGTAIGCAFFFSTLLENLSGCDNSGSNETGKLLSQLSNLFTNQHMICNLSSTLADIAEFIAQALQSQQKSLDSIAKVVSDNRICLRLSHSPARRHMCYCQHLLPYVG